MDTIYKAINHLNESSIETDTHTPVPFDQFLSECIQKPSIIIRNVFQVFHDLVVAYLGQGIDEYPDDPESINFVKYDCQRLFAEGADHPFFADRLFANRFVALVNALKRGAQQNMIYVFKGPPGCGKSTFLNNLLMKFEDFTNTDAGLQYETVWRFKKTMFGDAPEQEAHTVLERLMEVLDVKQKKNDTKQIITHDAPPTNFNEYIDIPCPSHDHPLLIIPKKYRRTFLDKLFPNSEFKKKLFTEMEYVWIFKQNPCTICSSLYRALFDKLHSAEKVFEFVFARPYTYNRQLGEGISVFNPGDEPISQKVLGDDFVQRRLNMLLNGSNKVRYIYSHYAKTNNGVYAIMDIKSNNTNRLIELHNIVSEGIHKVEEIEENVTSLFIAVMNPEDQKNIQNFKSFSDRIEYIDIPYVMDLNTEVEIYRNIFGKQIDSKFLPRVLRNFARVIISTRINARSKPLLELVQEPEKYKLYCDKNLNLLKMELYTGHIPTWLTEDDRKRLTSKLRRRVIAESETEGDRGISGRDSIRYFNEFYSTYGKDDKLINMSDLFKFFTGSNDELNKLISHDFLESLLHLYDYKVLHEVKESLYYFNRFQISKDIQNYLFAINFEIGVKEVCTYTGDRLNITEDFLEGIERRIVGRKLSKGEHRRFREETQKEYATTTLTQEMMIDSLPITRTKIYKSLYDRYVYNVKEKALDPFLENENFRRAIKDYNEKDFRTYDKRIQADVRYLVRNLCKKFGYTEQGAKEVCIYVIDNELAKKFKVSE